MGAKQVHLSSLFFFFWIWQQTFQRTYPFHSIHLNSRDIEKVLINQLIRVCLNHRVSILQINSSYEIYIALASKQTVIEEKYTWEKLLARATLWCGVMSGYIRYPLCAYLKPRDTTRVKPEDYTDSETPEIQPELS